MKSSLKEFADRCWVMYECYNKFNHTKKSRKRKEYLKKIFKAWYKCPDWDGNYNENYWQFVTEFNSDDTFKMFLWNNRKGLPKKFITIIIQEMLKRKKKIVTL